jgi:hypothetical protein
MFTLPNKLDELADVREALKIKFVRARAEFDEFRDECETGVDPRTTPVFYRVLVAHRKWQHAVEKHAALSQRKGYGIPPILSKFFNGENPK